MIVHIEGFDKNNNFINKTINTHSLCIKDMGKWALYNWFKNGEELIPDYNMWEEGGEYQVLFNNNYINILIKFKNNKSIISPFIYKDITIRELKDILSIKDNIYFDNIKLKDNKTLSYYNINHMDSLNFYTEDFIVSSYESAVSFCTESSF
jgi:hypothetical protein